MCLDIYSGEAGAPLAMVACHSKGGNQLFFFTSDQMIVTHGCRFCVGVINEHDTIRSLACTYQDSHWWKYDNEVLFISQ